MTQPRTTRLLRSIQSKRTKDAVRLAVRAGWSIRINGKQHLVLTPPTDAPPMTVSTTAQDAWQAVRADFRRRGLDLP